VKKIWVYTPAYAQAVVDKWSNWKKNNELAYTFLSITKSFKEFESQYKFSYVSTNSRGILLELTPRKSGLPRMRLLVDETSFMPVQTTVILESAEITSDVEGLKINPEISKDTFKFSVPKKTQIIELK
jgi:outer membrane lipoprotein-sorting protein